MIKRLNIGNVITDGKNYFTVWESYRKADGSAMVYTSDKDGKPLKKPNRFVKLVSDHEFKDYKRVCNISLAKIKVTVNGEELEYIKTTGKELNIWLSLFDCRYNLFDKYASNEYKKRFSNLENSNDHFTSAELVNSWFKAIKEHCPELKIKRITIK